MPILMASAFDDDLIKQIGVVIGTEARAWANHGFSGIDYWTPNVNPYRDPRWGRGAETPGEDAIRVSRYAKAMVEGLEGDQEERRVVATCKHYAANDFEVFYEHTRHNFDAKVSMQDLAEYYLLPFQQCARDSKVGSVMCAYNRVNGAPSCASDYLLNTVLRDHWKWTDTNNFVTSDCGAIKDIYLRHKWTETNAEGTAISFINGCDTLCEETWTADIPGAWEQGLLSEDIVDRSLQRLYEGLIQAGYFAGADSEWAHLGWDHVNTPEAQALALQSAVDGIVLLKNDDTLPLSLEEDAQLAIIGFWGDSVKNLYGDYSGRPPYSHTPAWAAEYMGYNVHVADGPVLEDDDAKDTWTEAALEAAQKSDYIIYFGGLDRTASSEENDRYTIGWPQAQVTLLKALAELGKPIVVVQLGDQIDNAELLQHDGINSIMWASWPGQDGGLAIMKLITGEESPAARLPVTQYPAEYAESLPPTSMALRPTSEYPGRTYRWYDQAIQPFGFGLHYTTFEASFSSSFPATIDIQDIMSQCENEYADTCDFPALEVLVQNTGTRKSDYVALAFVKADVGIKPYPLKTLVSYTRLRGIEPSATATGKLTWSFGELARRDEDGNTVLYPGEYTVLLDEPTRTETTFTLVGEAVMLDEWPVDPSLDGSSLSDEGPGEL